ncbi:MAG: NAD-dependent epimerase/dehydratase family protein [Elusimicrobiota bacterium]
MKALVTGGTGFLGSHLVEALLKKDFSVKCLVRDTKKLKWLKEYARLKPCPQLEIVCGDCSDKKTFESAVSDVDYVFHCAGLVRAINSNELYLTNVRGTKNLIEVIFLKNPGIKRFVYISSQAASGPTPSRFASGEEDGRRKTEDGLATPVSHYGFSKFLGELDVLKFKEKLPITILRPPSIYGPRDKDVFIFFDYAKKGFLPIPSDEKFINISYVSDIVDGIISSALSEKAKGQTYFIGDDKVFSWNDLCEILKKVVNPKAHIIKVPYSIFWTSAFFSEIFARIKSKPSFVSFDKLKEMKQKSWLLSSAKAKSDFGYSPKISLEEGVKITHNWYKNKGWLK